MTWVDVQVGDFNGDGKADIAGFDPATGQWWLALSTGQAFQTVPWAAWKRRPQWLDVQHGPFA